MHYFIYNYDTATELQQQIYEECHENLKSYIADLWTAHQIHNHILNTSGEGHGGDMKIYKTSKSNCSVMSPQCLRLKIN
jgi:hypothetical protein